MAPLVLNLRSWEHYYAPFCDCPFSTDRVRSFDSSLLLELCGPGKPAEHAAKGDVGCIENGSGCATSKARVLARGRSRWRAKSRHPPDGTRALFLQGEKTRRRIKYLDRTEGFRNTARKISRRSKR